MIYITSSMAGIKYNLFLILQTHVQEYLDLAMDHQPDLIVSPTEQVTLTSGKKKRKRSQKAALKHFTQLQRMLKEANSHSALLMPVLLGDDDGLDNYDMR